MKIETSKNLGKNLGANQVVKKLPTPVLSFPPAWPWFVDEMIPAYVKLHYSPRESWKDKPFTRDDVHFFSKGVQDLSELFGEDRPSRMPSYFQHPKFRSAYLLYFLQLQMAKFVTLFQMHSEAFDAAIEHGRKNGVIRIADLGAGPGTASLAFLLRVLQTKGELPPIELLWLDTNRSIMEDGQKLALGMADQFPKLRGKVAVTLQVGNWWDAPSALKGQSHSLIFLGHVLNEAQEMPTKYKAKKQDPQNYEDDEKPTIEAIWPELIETAGGGGVLFVEPAARPSSQFLSKLRDRFFKSETLDHNATSLWGPCLHAESCPLSTGKDYCHFSVSTRIPGKWFSEFSKSLGSERLWLKFSYLWVCSRDKHSTAKNPEKRLVISDPLTKNGEVLLCEPNRAGRLSTEGLGQIWRGDLLQFGSPKKPVKSGHTE